VTRMRAHAVAASLTMKLMILVLAAPGARAAEAANPSPASPPSDIAALKALEARAVEAIRKALPAVVAVNITPRSAAEIRDNVRSESGASGVIISRDGLILSQRHVSHVSRPIGKKNMDLAPGERIDIALQDGRRLKAELLGSDPVRDLSLLRIVDRGVYPYLEVAKANTVATGDRVIKLGHPFGYRADRGATARLGRVLYTGASIEIVADCLTSGGDSGGPLIDLDGRLVGLVENGSAPQMVIFSYPPRCGNPMCYSSTATIARLMPAMLNAAAGANPIPESDVNDLPEFKAMMVERKKELYGGIDSKVLPFDQWSGGETSRAAWRRVTGAYSGVVVEVLGAHDRRVAYGTVVGADGWILTKASEIPDDPRCRLATGEIVTARVAGVDVPYDVALLKVDAARGLRAAEWCVEKVRPAEKLLAAPDGRGGSIGVGMVSVEQRALEGPFPATVTKAWQYVPKPLFQPLLGKMIEGKGLLVKRVKDPAARAGIAPGDLLLSVNGQPFRDAEDIDHLVARSSAGDHLPIVIERNGRQIKGSLPLDEDPYIRCPGATAWYRNLRADDFPAVFEHDIPLTLDECGGPLIDLDGKAVGITIARVGQHGCMAIPADVIPALVLRLKK
jgi:serine protease Do